MYTYPDRNGTHKHIKHGNKFVRENVPTRKPSIVKNYEVFYNESEIIIECHPSIVGKIFAILTFPVSLLIYGIGNYREICSDHYNVIFSKKSGSFTEDRIFKNNLQKLLDKLPPV